ncbi:hypothetical protein Rhal01_02739 [Rubritalea halochordaticola]|uniref:Ice-binding protein C-terminal domain-containing protein n=2 Tax=Rubritalea halochordaticola TaxID=714537 RepID=A0ABP9V3F6_9BACT
MVFADNRTPSLVAIVCKQAKHMTNTKLLTTVLGLSAALIASSTAATITLANADFEVEDGTEVTTGWTSIENGINGPVYRANDVAALGGTAVALFKARDTTIDGLVQSIGTGEATADTYSSFTVNFDAGYRNYTGASEMSFVFSIVDLSSGDPAAGTAAILGTATYTLTAASSTGSNLWEWTDAGQSVTINYDNSAVGLAGHEIGLLIDSGATVYENYQTTAMLDNISVTAVNAVPEPSSTALIGLAGLGFILRRRR